MLDIGTSNVTSIKVPASVQSAGGAKYARWNNSVISDGKLYCMPTDSTNQVLVLDLATVGVAGAPATVSSIEIPKSVRIGSGDSLGYKLSCGWKGCVAGVNGKVYVPCSKCAGNLTIPYCRDQLNLWQLLC